MSMDWLNILSRSSAKALKPGGPSALVMIDWTGSWLSVTEVTRHAGQLRLSESHRQQFDLSNSSGQTAAAAWLGDLLRREKIETRDAIVCAPRRYVAFKLLTMPAVSDDRLAEAVHLQCETMFPVAAGDLVIDFVAQPLKDLQNSRAVLVAVIPRAQIASIQETLAAAQLNCRSIIVPELAMARSEVSSAVEREAIVLLSPGKIEYTLRSHGLPVLCYAAKAPSDEHLAHDVSSTLRRLQASIPPTIMDGPLSSIRFLHIQPPGAPVRSRIDGPTFLDQLRRQLLINVSYRSVAREEQAKAEAITAALLDPHCRIDFAEPRRPVDHRRLARQQRVRIAAALLLVGLLGWTAARLNSIRLDSRIAALTKQHKELQAQIAQEQPRWQQVAMVAHWQDSHHDYSQLIGDLIATLPDNQRMMLTRLEVNQNAQGQCELHIEGLAQNSQCVNELVDQFIANPQYAKPQLRRLEAKTGDNRYSSDFAVTVEVIAGVRS